jgi:hypothetical protein
MWYNISIIFQKERVMSKKSLRLPALLIFGIYTLYSCVLMPLENYIFADILLFQTIWGDVIDVLAHWFEIAGIAAILGTVIYACYRYPLRELPPILILCGGALLYKYVAAVVAVGLSGGLFYFPEDLYSILVSLLIEVALVAFTLLLCHRLLTDACQKDVALSKASAKLGQEYTPTGELVPFARPISRTHPLLRSAFWGMIAVLIALSLSYVIEEIAFTAAGATFSASDIPILLIYWLLLFAIPCVGGYFLAVYFMPFAKWLEERNEKKDPIAEDPNESELTKNDEE